MKITPPPSRAQAIAFQGDVLFLQHPDEARRELPYRWSHVVLMWLAVFAISGLSSVSGNVRSLDGTIKFDSNFDGAPEAVLNATGFGIGTTTPSNNLHVAGNSIVSGTMVVGGTSNVSGSNLHISGSWGFSVQTVAGNTTLSGNSVVLADSSSGNITLTLPVASTVSGRVYTVKKKSNSHSVFINSISGLVLDLASGANGYPCVQVVSDGNNWHVMGQMPDGISYYQYLIIDVSGGPTATSYPLTVASLSNEDLTGAGNEQYKTNKIVLRYIPAGTFMMGSPVGEAGRDNANEIQPTVTLMQGFYIGVFEVTQRQFLKVVASYPGVQSFTNSSNTMPLHAISYTDIRGSGDWPSSGNAVLASSFIGLLRSKSGLASFDLPTEAQWEYACRSGTTGALNNSSANVLAGQYVEDHQLKTLGWYDWNARSPGGGGAGGVNGTREVGAKLPNSWGLLDMHGNVSEWCLDRHEAYTVLDRVIRGGSYSERAQYCRSASRSVGPQSGRYGHLGFRLALPVGQ